MTAFCLFYATTVCKAVSPQEVTWMEAAMPTAPVTAPKSNRQLLLFSLTKGFVHSSIPYWTKAIELMGRKTGAFQVTHSTDMSVFSPDTLGRFDAICFNNTTELGFEDVRMRKALMDFVTGGKGIVGIHAAADNFHSWPEAAEMMGSKFAGHPWTAGGTWRVKIDEPDHPLTQPFQGKGFAINDEIYRTDPPAYSRDNQRVLLSLDMTDPTNLSAPGITPSDMDTGVSWIKNWGKGRVFYGSLGHQHHLTWNPQILAHYLAGIQFALGDLAADATPKGPIGPALASLLDGARTYDQGKTRSHLAAITKMIHEHPAQAAIIEGKLIAFLGQDATLTAKRFVCQQLRQIGTKESVPVLAALLSEPQTADMARYALEGIDDPSVDTILLRALGTSSGKTRIGIINSLGQRRFAGALGALSGLLYDADTAVTEAAAAALGHLANEPAAEALAKAAEIATGSQRQTVVDAYVACVDGLVRSGRGREALRIYNKLYRGTESTAVRVAALRGIVETSVDQSAVLHAISAALQSGNGKIRRAAAALVRLLPNRSVAKVSAQLASLPVDAQVQLLTSLGDRPVAGTMPLLVEASQSADPAVRNAALSAMGRAGGDSAVLLLANASATEAGALRRVARESLDQLSAPGVNAVLLSCIGNATPQVRAELARSMGQRQMTEAVPELLKLTQDNNQAVRIAAYRSLRALAGPDVLDELIARLVQMQGDRERRETERCVAAAAGRIQEKKRRDDAVLAALSSAQTVDARCSLLVVLGTIGSSESIPILRRALNGADDRVRRAAIRSLSEWPTAQPMADLHGIASSSDDRASRILALRGYIRLIGISTISDEEKAQYYSEAVGLATEDSEKRLILKELSEVRTIDTLRIAADLLDVKATAQEASVASITIARHVRWAHGPETRDVLQRVMEVAAWDWQRDQAQDMIDNINRNHPKE